MPKLITTEDYIQSCIAVHGANFNYDKLEYLSAKEDVEIKCNTCKTTFWQNAHNHKNGIGCSTCSEKKAYTTETYIEAVKEIHNDMCSYDRVVYAGNRSEIEIKCNVCKTYFTQLATSHLQGGKCPCKREK